MQTKECWNCGAIQEVNAGRCKECGQPLIHYKNHHNLNKTKNPDTRNTEQHHDQIRLCPICETVNDIADWSCKNCGRTLSVASIVDLSGQKKEKKIPPNTGTGNSPTENPKPNSQTNPNKFCTNCGAQILHQGVFCHACGSQIAEAIKPNQSNQLIKEYKADASLSKIVDGLFDDDKGKEIPTSISSSEDISTFSTIRLVYYWANAIVNPIILLVLIGSEFNEKVVIFMIIWTLISGIVNPRLFGYVATLLGEGITAFMAIIFESCFVIIFGGIGAILVMAVMVAFATICFTGLFALGCFLLFIDAVFMLLRINRVI